MYLKRRDVLKVISLAGVASPLGLLSSCSHQKFYNPDQDIIFGGGKFKQNDAIRQVIAITNIQQQDKRLIDIDFLAHGIIIDPNDKNRLLAFEKNGSNAVVVNLTSNSSTQRIAISQDKKFNGHATFDKTGSRLYCTETYLENEKGFISIQDGKSLQIIGEFPSYGENPHQCQLIDNDTILVVTNTGSVNAKNPQASITYIDVQSEKLIERVTLDNQQLNAGHFEITDDGSLIVASAPREGIEPSQEDKGLGGVSIRSKNRAILTMTQPEVVIDQLRGEALGIVIDEKHKMAAITHPDANMLTFWSIEKRQLIKAMSIPNPRGITLSIDGRSFIISYNFDTSVVRVNTKNLSANPDSIIQPSYISGEHLYNWSRTLTQIMPSNVYSDL
jgi:hypothetical protein